MAVKKLSIKKGKTGKLKIHKSKPKPEEQEELELEEDEVLAEDEVEEEEPEEEAEEEEPPFDPDPVEGVDEETGEIYIEGQIVNGQVAILKDGELVLEDYEQVAELKHESAAPKANVGYGLDRTINLGNYESLKIHVTIHVPSEVDEEEIEGNYAFCKGWTEQKMDEAVAEYTDDDEADDIPF